MLEQYLGEERFRDGIRHYLSTHAYGNTDTHDLWDALEETSGEPVRRMMDSWIFQGGHPVVSSAAGPDGEITISQRRFRYLAGSEGADGVHDASPVWTVPIRIRSTAGETRALADPHASVDLAGSPITLNVDGSGFYRTRLTDQHLERIAADGPSGLAPIERYGVVDDTWALVLAGELHAKQFCDLALGFRSEDDLSVWQRILGSLDSILRATDAESRPAFRRFVLDLIGPARHRLGPVRTTGESERTSQLRGALFAAAGALGDDDAVVAQARDLVVDVPADPALAVAALEVVASHGTPADHATFVDRMRHAASPQEAERYRGTLADFPGRAEVEATLALTLDGTIRTQDIPFVVRRALRNPDQGFTAWRFVSSNWDALTAAIPSNLVARMLEGIPALAERDQAETVTAFLDHHPVPQGHKLIEQHRERLAVQELFRERERRPLRDWLSSLEM
jgi:puromycin-sensitive aminopeptidase